MNFLLEARMVLVGEGSGDDRWRQTSAYKTSIFWFK
jgi:hypothetical protein